MRPPHPELVEHTEREPGIRWLAHWQLKDITRPARADVQAALAATWLAFETLSFVSAFERGEPTNG